MSHVIRVKVAVAAVAAAVSAAVAAPPAPVDAAPAVAEETPRDAPDQTVTRAVLEVYSEQARSPEVQAMGRAAKSDYYREWHERLTAAAAADPPGDSRSRALSEASILAKAIGDVPAAIRAAETWAESPADETDHVLAVLRLTILRGEAALKPGTPDADIRTAVAGHRAALEEFAHAPRSARSGMAPLFAPKVASQYAALVRRLGNPAVTAAAYDDALTIERTVQGDAAAAGRAALLAGPLGAGSTRLLTGAAVAAAAAGEDAAAARSVADLAERRRLPPSVVALAVARGADLAGAGGSFLTRWLADAKPDDGRSVALYEVAVEFDATGRDAEALPLFEELRSDHGAALAALPAASPSRSPHAIALARLGVLLDAAGALDEGDAVRDELRRRYPEAPLYVSDPVFVSDPVPTVPR